MKRIVTTPAVDIALRTLDQEDRRKVEAWFNRLRNWDSDPFVREHSHRLDSASDVYVLKTSTDLRIFFSLQGITITIRDIARKQSIVASGSFPEDE